MRGQVTKERGAAKSLQQRLTSVLDAIRVEGAGVQEREIVGLRVGCKHPQSARAHGTNSNSVLGCQQTESDGTTPPMFIV
eukprot:2872739-Rhodomonas_salina.1